MAAPVALPRATLSGHQLTVQGQLPEKAKMALSPLATGVTVTNEPQTKYVTRPKTPVMPVAHLQTRYPVQQHFTTLPSRGRQPAGDPRFDATPDKFAVVPQPALAYPDNTVKSAWHASLPRPANQVISYFGLIGAHLGSESQAKECENQPRDFLCWGGSSLVTL